MCCAIGVSHGRWALCRNLDLEYSIDRGLLTFCEGERLELDGVGAVKWLYGAVGVGISRKAGASPLLFDGVNGVGLAIAALNFPGCAVYAPKDGGGESSLNMSITHGTDDARSRNIPASGSIPSYAVIPYILATCATVGEAEDALRGLAVNDGAVSDDLPSTPLHWFIFDGRESLTVEPLAEGLSLRRNATAVLTNSPDLDGQLRAMAEGCPGGDGISATAVGQGNMPGGVSDKARFYTNAGDYSSEARFCRGRELLSLATAQDAPLLDTGDMLRLCSAMAIPYGTHPKSKGFLYTRYSAVMMVDRPEYLLLDYESCSLRRRLVPHAPTG